MNRCIYLLILFFIASVTPSIANQITIVNDSAIYEYDANSNFAGDSVLYVGYDGGLEYLVYDVPTTPEQYIIITSNYTADSAISSYENIVSEERPYIDTSNNSLNFWCQDYWDCELNYISVYSTTQFDINTITWNNKPALGTLIHSSYMVTGYNSIILPSSLSNSCGSSLDFSNIALWDIGGYFKVILSWLYSTPSCYFSPLYDFISKYINLINTSVSWFLNGVYSITDFIGSVFELLNTILTFITGIWGDIFSSNIYASITFGIILMGISLVIFLRIYNIIAGTTILGFKLPKI
jgi:hypothetical protein